MSDITLPPESNLRRLQPDLLAKILTLTKNEPIDLGDIKIGAGIGLVEISVVKSSGQPYFQSAGDWRSHFYVLRHENGEPITARGISISDTKSGVNEQEGV